MSTTLDQVIGGQNLTGVIQGVTTGVPNVFPAGFYQVDKTVDGDTGEYTRVDGTRATARIAAYGSPSQQRHLKSISKVPVKLIHTIESIYFRPSVLVNLTEYSSPDKQQLGIVEVTRQTREFRRLFDNLRVATLTQMLFTGQIYFDGAGNLLPSSTGAAVTVDFGVPDGNQDQLNVFGSGAIIDASWDSATTTIATQVQNLRKASRKLTGYPLAHAFYGQNVLDYLLNNNNVKELINRNIVLNAAAAQSDIPSPLFGLNWHPAYEAFFEDQNGVNQDLVGPDQVLFTPEPSTDWVGWLEGTYPVPTTVGQINVDAAASTGNVRTVAGMFSYGQVMADPVTIKQVAGDTFLPVLKVPKSIFIATVKF
jgi:hypothetical protein